MTALGQDNHLPPLYVNSKTGSNITGTGTRENLLEFLTSSQEANSKSDVFVNNDLAPRHRRIRRKEERKTAL